MESLGELQWARIFVKTRGDFLLSVLEIEMEEDTYFLSLWWEFQLMLRKKMVGCSEVSGRKGREVRGDVDSRAGMRVEDELIGSRIETLTLSAEVTGEQESGVGWEIVNRA